MDPVNQMLFTDVKGSVTLSIFSISILFSSIIMTLTAVIQSLNFYKAPVLIVLAGVVSKWFLDLWFIPRYQISGAAISTVLALLGMTIALSVILKNCVKAPLFMKRDIWIILRSAVLMGVALFLFNSIFGLFSNQTRWESSLQALLGVGVGAIVFTTTVLRSNLFTQEELVLLPFGYKLIRLNKKE